MTYLTGLISYGFKTKLKNKKILVCGSSQGLGFACVQILEDDLGIIDGLVINAGGPPTGDALSFNEEEWLSSINQNLLSAVWLTKAFVPQMIKQNYGRIVAITSSSAKQPLPHLVLSNTTRVGVQGYLKTLSNEISCHNVLVNSVLPGTHKTKRLEGIIEKWAEKEGLSIEEMEKKRTAQIPMGRFGKPEELANFIVFLLSGKNTYITGQAIAVDGGYQKSVV